MIGINFRSRPCHSQELHVLTGSGTRARLLDSGHGAVAIPSSSTSPRCRSSRPAPRRSSRLVAKQAERVKVDAGKVIVTEGAAGSEFFVILDGPGPRRAPRPEGRDCSARAASSATSPSSTARRATRRVIAETPMELAKLGQRAFDGLLDDARASRRSCSPAWRAASASEDAKTPVSDRPACRHGSFAAVREACRGRTSSSSIVGVLVALGTLASGIAPRDHRVARRTRAITREPFVQRARRRCTGPSTPIAATMLFVVRVAGEPARAQLRAGQARRPPHHQGQRAPPAARLPRRRLDADAAARPGRRRRCTRSSTSASSWLFIATVVLEIDHQLPDDLKFLHGGVYQGYSFAADLAGVVFVVGILWAIGAPLPRAAVPDPHQDQARGRGDPRHVPRDRGHRLRHRGAAHRGRVGRPDFEKWSFVGYGLSSLVRRLDGRRPRRRAPLVLGRALRRVRRVPRDPARPRSCGT